MAETAQSRPMPLDGIKVLELTGFLAGPFCASMLADFGAEVIKVEPPKVGDAWRRSGTMLQGHSLDFLTDNRGKKGITLNLKHPKGQEIARKLAARSDVLLENFREGVLEGWGLGWEDLRRLKPGLVMVRISGFGQTGPYRHRPAFGRVAEGMSGLTYIVGEPDGAPVAAGLGWGDMTTGMLSAFAILAALRHRDRTGEGQWIDAAICESLLRLMGEIPAVYKSMGEVRERTGAWNPENPTNGHFQAKDGGWLVTRCHNDATAHRLFNLMGHPEMASDPRFATLPARQEHWREVMEAVKQWVASLTRQEVLDALQQADIATGPIYSIADVYAEPHFQEREVFVDVDHPKLGPIAQPRPAPRLSATPGTVRSLGPELGEHNEEVLCGILGLSKDELASLAQEAVI